MKIIDFKTACPLFELERDGLKPFTIRLVDYKDKRFKSLAQWQQHFDWALRITNPANGESFIRKIVSIDFVRYVDWKIASQMERPFWERLRTFEPWKIIVLGELLEPSP